jgi:hypothetical protein
MLEPREPYASPHQHTMAVHPAAQHSTAQHSNRAQQTAGGRAPAQTAPEPSGVGASALSDCPPMMTSSRRCQRATSPSLRMGRTSDTERAGRGSAAAAAAATMATPPASTRSGVRLSR